MNYNYCVNRIYFYVIRNTAGLLYSMYHANFRNYLDTRTSSHFPVIYAPTVSGKLETSGSGRNFAIINSMFKICLSIE